MISVIIPVYNAERFLKETIDSVLKQTFPDWEMILVDDGSTDESGKICDSFAEKDKRIKVVHIQNGGVSNARNVGLSIATGEWVQFVDSDDRLCPNAMEILIRHKEEADVVVFGYETFPVYGRNIYTNSVKRLETLSDTTRYFEFLYGKCFYNSIWNKLYRREKISNRFDRKLSLGEDLLFNLEFLKSCNGIKIIPEALYQYRREKNSGSLTKKARKDGLEIQLLLKEKVDEAFNFDDKVCQATLKTLLSAYVGTVQLLVYDTNVEKKETIAILSSWQPKIYPFLASIDLSSQRFEKKLVLKYTAKNKIRNIYRYFSCKKIVAKLLRR